MKPWGKTRIRHQIRGVTTQPRYRGVTRVVGPSGVTTQEPRFKVNTHSTRSQPPT